MREIKFRTWFKSIRRMVISDQIRLVYPAYAGDDGEGNVVLMQFTGLQDKNGKDIYEGDIVEYLDNTGWGLVIKRAVIEDIRRLPDFTCSKWEQVIGNRYEHPELLEAAS